MYSLIIYDTSNFIDFPIGGQLTSIRNFLTYVSQFQTEFCSKILLVGLTTNFSKLGKVCKVDIKGKKFDCLPVVYRDDKLNVIKSSLRIEFLKGLFKYKGIVPHGKNVIHYIHSPEAFIQVKLCHPFAKTVIFSHGSFFNMVTGFRFFKNNRFVAYCFEQFIKCLLKKSDMILVLDNDSLNQYRKYNRKVKKINNSIILPDEGYENKKIHNPVKVLFVGRLSKVKRIDEIIRAIDEYKEDVILTIVGDGEERDNLKSLVKTKRIIFKGALKPYQVKEEMINSDILIMNSILEGKPMTIIEAMSYGMPIVTTDVGGISELVKFGENAVKTDGTATQIKLALEFISKNYSSYSKKSISLSKNYDYRVVNKAIFDMVMIECLK